MAKLINLFHRERDEFEQLLIPHMEHLVRLAYRFTGNNADAEDLVQELLIQLYARKTDLKPVGHLRSWLVRGLYYRYVDSVRSAVRDPLKVLEDEEVDALIDPKSSSERAADNDIQAFRLDQAMAQLNPDQKALMSLHDMEGYTLAELETLLETPIGTLKSRLHRARKMLRKAMEPFIDDLRDT